MLNKLNKIFATNNKISPLILRLTLGIVIFPHGAQKALGWFGGHGFSATLSFFTDKLSVPWIFALAVILAEFLGSLGLIFGAFTRLSAAGIGAVMLTATLMIHTQYGFFMNWAGKNAGEGFEYHLLALGIVAVLIIQGGGRFALDHKIVAMIDKFKSQIK